MWAIKQIHKSDKVSFLRDARDYSLLNGAVLRYDSMSNDNCVAHIPLTAFPSPMPDKLYRECLDLQPIINKLMMFIANDPDFMNEILGPISEVDKFTQNLLAIENTIRREGRAQPIMSCISRADYMLHKMSTNEKMSPRDLAVRQVEVNAIASGMSAHSRNIKNTQELLMSKYSIFKQDNTIFPTNDSLDLVVDGLIDAFDSYGKSSAQILLVAEPRSTNFSDQILIEIAVHRRRRDIRFVRRRFDKLPSIMRLGPNKELLLEESKEIAVVYFRIGYDPSQYTFENAWETRLLLERSRAIKCPSINFHLSGAKKFQQVLNSREQLERFLDTDEASKLEKVFCKIWSIESELSEGYKLAMATTDSNKLVLKPQREGGGHNIFAQNIKPFVEQLTNARERSQYILMEYIDGPREQNLLLLYDDQPEHDSVRMDACDQLISELGIFGSILADNNSTILSNRAAGYLVRSKRFGVNEGGVAAGYSSISNLILLQDDDADLTEYFVQE
uniref:Glutathione synthetase n=1 Tax=Aceria tosichella TaxID=561515 RepID=A0A6G1SMQ6_9ACAR